MPYNIMCSVYFHKIFVVNVIFKLCTVSFRSTAADSSKRKAYLPDAKQYLVTKNGESSPLPPSAVNIIFNIPPISQYHCVIFIAGNFQRIQVCEQSG